MSFNINTFRSIVAPTDVLRKNRFRVRFNMPMGLLNDFKGDFQYNVQNVREVEYWADGTSIPTQGLAKGQSYRYGYGVAEQRPFSKTYTECNISFIVDSYAEKWKFFDRWMNMVFNSDMAEGINERTEAASMGFFGERGVSAYEPYQLAYKDEYITDVRVEVFNQLGDIVLVTVLRDAFPSGMAAMDFNWKDNNSAQNLHVQFSFTDMFRLV